MSVESRSQLGETRKQLGLAKGQRNPFFGKPRPVAELRVIARRKQLKAKGYYKTPAGYRVYITVEGKRTDFGYFATERDAKRRVREVKEKILCIC